MISNDTELVDNVIIKCYVQKKAEHRHATSEQGDAVHKVPLKNTCKGKEQ